MSMLAFPSPATYGQFFPDPPIVGVPIWQWDGAKWRPATGPGGGGGGGATVQVSPTPPSDPPPNMLWWNSTSNMLHVFYGGAWLPPSLDDGEWP